MKTLLEAIQTYPEQFISTLEARADTMSSATNREIHLHMKDMIMLGNWVTVGERLFDMDYGKPLEGVIFSLDRHSDIDNNVLHQIVDLYNEEKFV